MKDWQPIETAPHDPLAEVLLAGRYPSGRWEVRSGSWLATRWPFVGLDQPTHWMPLPDPPADAGS